MTPSQTTTRPTGDEPQRVNGATAHIVLAPNAGVVDAQPPAVNHPGPHQPTNHDPAPNQPADEDARTTKLTPAARRVLVGVTVALGVVILAPIALSSQDLYAWATAPRGLGLGWYWPYLVPLALDLAAAACIGMTIVGAWRRAKPGIFGILVWVFAATSAYAQFKHGVAERDAGRAQDAVWAMPAFALLGPLLLEVTLHKLRLWARQDAGEQHVGSAGFGKRWLVAPLETASAWAASRREGIAKADDAIRFVRTRKALAGMHPVEALHYAFGELGPVTPHQARVWLAARNVIVDQQSIDVVVAERRAAEAATSRPPKRQPTDPTGRATNRGRRPTNRRRARPSTTPDQPAASTGQWSPAVVGNAAALRERYGNQLPDSDQQIRKDMGWQYDRARKARAAFIAGADLTQGANQ